LELRGEGRRGRRDRAGLERTAAFVEHAQHYDVSGSGGGRRIGNPAQHVVERASLGESP
jgi:hypothetical protein